MNYDIEDGCWLCNKKIEFKEVVCLTCHTNSTVWQKLFTHFLKLGSFLSQPSLGY